MGHREIHCTLPSGILKQEVFVTQIAGGTNKKVGFVQYKLCPPGTSNEKLACVSCLPGTYSDGSTGQCDSCEKGRYSDKVGQSSCQDCSLDKFAPKRNLTACIDCTPGTHKPPGKNIECELCMETQMYMHTNKHTEEDEKKQKSG